ncbi:MAG: undecaprenyldiphospho-muramoylpentapeptide beta-N-acetylglucosaminyltransferase [Ignavibacteriales bacterium]|nr:undecaprenyldiphospho-muramoylpentapeptide beta-N-acetylglucosaminyltransferase [Ignavibacteriales bacterium]
MSQLPFTLILAGGGTGGHVFPALAIAAELKKLRPEARIIFVGTKNRIEERIVPGYGYDFTTLWIGGFQRSLGLQHFLFPLKLLVSTIQSFFLIRHTKPSAVIGTGGYVCGPALAAAVMLGVPAFIHESNSYPGATTRLLASHATRVFLGLDDARRWLREKEHIELVGTPTSDSFEKASKEEALRHFGLDNRKPVVFVTGGSQGSVSINNAVLASVSRLGKRVQLLWQTGPRHFEVIRKATEGTPVGWIGPFIERMDLAYAAADLVVCRAGATTIAELTRVGIPAILVPYPFAAGDHQTHNARSLVESGAALLIPDSDLGSRLSQEIRSLLDNPEKQRGMAVAAKRLGRPEAARVVAERIMEIISKKESA